MERVSYGVDIVGQTWQGFESSYHYTFDSGLPTFDDIRRRAGDFQGITDYRIVEWRETGDWKKSTTERNVVQDWETEAGEELFMQLQD